MLSELCKLHSLGKQHNTLDTVRESVLKWENWKNTYVFFYFKTYQGGKNAFLTISEEKLHRWRKIWRIRREVWTSRRFLGASCVWQHLQLFLYSMSLTIGSTLAPFCGGCPSSGVCLMVRLGWGGVDLVSQTPVINWPSCHILSGVHHHMIHCYWCWPWSPGWGLLGSPLSSYATPAPTIGLFTHRNSTSLSQLYPGSPLHPCSTTGCKLSPEDSPFTPSCPCDASCNYYF